MSGNYFCHVCGGLVDLIKLQPSDVRLCECEKRFARLRAENKMLAEELNEQARLLGISAEKELALRAENERLKAELAEAKKDAEWRRTQLIDVVRKLTPEFDAAMKGNDGH